MTVVLLIGNIVRIICELLQNMNVVRGVVCKCKVLVEFLLKTFCSVSTEDMQ